ncbi:class II aldolase/adducin family protein [Saccharomonospora sp. NPDC046836]|uniref:class II aldolase/adducin family protein n=1 Tax=Saccharomonospora sp. NPDC046836 TaxID=3156921 RepID=UPI0033CE6266
MTSTASVTAPSLPAVRDRDVRWELAAALRTFERLGYEFGFNGHVSGRAPEFPGHYWVNPFGVSLGAVTPADLVLVDGDGEIVPGSSPHGINGFAGNLALHRQVPAAEVVVHLHTRHGFVWSNLGRPLDAVTTDSALVTELQGLTTHLFGIDGGSLPVEHAVAGRRVILQQGHGFVTLGESVGAAAFYLIAAERAAQANLALLGVEGRPVLAPEIVKRWTLTPQVARAHFEPYFTLREAEGLS